MKSWAAWFVWISPLPLVVFMFTLWFARSQQGWSAWASAGIFALPIGISFLLGGFGMILTFRAMKLGNPLPMIALATIVAAAPAFWLVMRAMFH